MACVAFSCKSYRNRRNLFTKSKKRGKGKGLSFYRFPQDETFKQLWIKAIDRKNWKPKRNSRLCSKHFTTKCYLLENSKRYLCRDAVPTIFENYPSYKGTNIQISSNIESYNPQLNDKDETGNDLKQTDTMERDSIKIEDLGTDYLKVVELEANKLVQENVDLGIDIIHDVDQDSFKIEYLISDISQLDEVADKYGDPENVDLQSYAQVDVVKEEDTFEFNDLENDLTITDNILEHERENADMISDIKDTEKEINQEITPTNSMASDLECSLLSPRQPGSCQSRRASGQRKTHRSGSVGSGTTLPVLSDDNKTYTIEFCMEPNCEDQHLQPPISCVNTVAELKRSVELDHAYLYNGLRIDQKRKRVRRQRQGKGRSGDNGESRTSGLVESEGYESCSVNETTEENSERLREELALQVSRQLEDRTARKVSNTRQGRNCNVLENTSEIPCHDFENVIVKQFVKDLTAMEFQCLTRFDFHGRAETYLPVRIGSNVSPLTAHEAFTSFWDDCTLEHIVRNINRYAAELKTTSKSFSKYWYETNVDEIMILFAFWIMLGIIRMPSIKSCYSNNLLMKTSIFRTLMAEGRYWHLNRALAYNSSQDLSRLSNLSPVIERLNEKFMKCYTPDRHITIDESETLWKEESLDRDSEPDIQFFELREASTGYLWSMYVCSDGNNASASTNPMPKSTEVVLRLVRPLLNKGYALYMDEWFNSPLLARFLKRNKTDCVGPLQKDHVPETLQQAAVPEGGCVAWHSGDVAVVVYQDKQPVYTISTCHGTERICYDARPDAPPSRKLAVIAHYEHFTAGIHRKEQPMEPYLQDQKNVGNWYKKILKRLVNVSIFNCQILMQKWKVNQADQQAYRLELVNQILTKHLKAVPRP